MSSASTPSPDEAGLVAACEDDVRRYAQCGGHMLAGRVISDKLIPLTDQGRGLADSTLRDHQPFRDRQFWIQGIKGKTCDRVSCGLDCIEQSRAFSAFLCACATVKEHQPTGLLQERLYKTR